MSFAFSGLSLVFVASVFVICLLSCFFQPEWHCNCSDVPLRIHTLTWQSQRCRNTLFCDVVLQQYKRSLIQVSVSCGLICAYVGRVLLDDYLGFLVSLAVIMLSFAPFSRFSVEIVSTMTCSEPSGTLNPVISACMLYYCDMVSSVFFVSCFNFSFRLVD